MHQPLVWHKNRLVSNLETMLLSKDQQTTWNAKLIARAYKNPAKYVNDLRKKGFNPRIMLDFSGILLEGLNSLSKILKKTDVEGEKIGDIIKLYSIVLKKYPSCIEFAGTAYSHCYFPVTPEDDWEWQIGDWRDIFKKLFGDEALKNVKGFWFPEMGIPGDEEKLSKLIKILKDFGYEWIILPIETVEGEKEMTQEKKIKMTSQPHILSVKNQEIKVIFRVRYDFIDQQSGCDANDIYKKCLEAAKTFDGKKPALVVPASDGENGNVMMNEFFPQTFVPFFMKKLDNKVSSLTVSQFLEEYYDDGIESKIKIKKFGGSWIGSHEHWTEGSERGLMNQKIHEISEKFHEIKPEKLEKNVYNFIRKLLLISETSCYTYWNDPFWFEQWGKINDILEKNLEKL
jgi:hypothetical protein